MNATLNPMDAMSPKLQAAIRKCVLDGIGPCTCCLEPADGLFTLRLSSTETVLAPLCQRCHAVPGSLDRAAAIIREASAWAAEPAAANTEPLPALSGDQQ